MTVRHRHKDQADGEKQITLWEYLRRAAERSSDQPGQASEQESPFSGTGLVVPLPGTGRCPRQRAAATVKVRVGAPYASTEGPPAMASSRLSSPEFVGGYPAPSAGLRSSVRPPTLAWVLNCSSSTESAWKSAVWSVFPICWLTLRAWSSCTQYSKRSFSRRGGSTLQGHSQLEVPSLLQGLQSHSRPLQGLLNLAMFRRSPWAGCLHFLA
ncbi:hypothetical protein CRENBAI_010068 [Crenichthys baileyi]|uniref:Uncharacterized protein n=1 Tax=Crenichthys baileyi TaxID=28760 RepID=A0AAV9QTH8_9TELE